MLRYVFYLIMTIKTQIHAIKTPKIRQKQPFFAILPTESPAFGKRRLKKGLYSPLEYIGGKK